MQHALPLLDPVTPGASGALQGAGHETPPDGPVRRGAEGDTDGRAAARGAALRGGSGAAPPRVP
jgi:hypothetical protein